MNKNNIPILIILTIFCLAIVIGSVSANENVTDVISAEQDVDEIKSIELQYEHIIGSSDENDKMGLFESDLSAVEKTTDEDILSQSANNDTMGLVETVNETILGEIDIVYGSDYIEITNLTISGINDYYYYGDIIKFNVFHSRFYNGEPCSTYVEVLVDNDHPNSYGTVLQTGQNITLYAGSLLLGLHTISARYSDHTTNLDEVDFYVLENPVKFSKATKKVKKSKNVKVFKITAKLANGKALSKKYIYMKIKGKTYKAKTNSKGVVTFKLLLPKKTKTYSYKVKYYGDYGYKAKTYSGKLKVK